MKETIAAISIAIVVVFCIGAVGIACDMAAFSHKTTSVVRTVGGCDKFGQCSVITAEGKYYPMCKRPVAGAKARCTDEGTEQ